MTPQNEPVTRRPTMPNSFDPGGLADLPPAIRTAIERRRRSLSSGYRLFYSRPLAISRGEGSYLYDAADVEYLDAYNNVPCIGHAHPLVTERVAAQLARLNIGNRYLQDEVVEYSERLLECVGMDAARVMYTCSGSEANDLAYRVAARATGGQGLIVTANAYHGVTAAVAAFSPSLGEAVPLGPHVRTIEPPRPGPGENAEGVADRMVAQVQAAIADLRRHGVELAAFVCDTIFASDGIYFEPVGVLRRIAEVVRANGGLVIADEVQAGFHRTGRDWWGYQRHGLVPDIVTMGKAIANGMPLAAAVMRADIDAGFGESARYVSTFGGISAGVAAASAVLQVLEDEDLGARAEAVGDRLAADLGGVFDEAGVGVEIRQRGLFLAIEPRPEGGSGPALTTALVEGLRERRVLASTTGARGTALKVRPPMVFGQVEATRFVEAMAATLADLPGQSGGDR